jgi:hypothetical protein
MSPVELRPVPPPNRQPLWLFWTRRYIARAIIRIGFEILRVGVWIYGRAAPRSSWIFAVARRLIDFGNRIAPKGRHESMMRQPANEKDDSP